jgi:biopolymer transport protein ExbD
MAARTGGSSDEPIADVNIVPFVDIILVVLIIFMVTAPVLLKPSINVNLPKAASGDNTSPSELSVTIMANGDVSLNGKPTNEEALGTYSKDLATKNPEVEAIISADKETTHGRVVTIIDAIKSAGVRKFAITIDKKASR